MRISDWSSDVGSSDLLSDTHLVAQGELYDAVDASTRLREVLSGIVASGARPDALIFTGDLTDQGHPDAYAELKAIVEHVAAEVDSKEKGRETGRAQEGQYVEISVVAMTLDKKN